MEVNVSGPKHGGRRYGTRRAPKRKDEEDRRGDADRRAQGFARALIGTFLTVKLYRFAEALKFLKAVKLLDPLVMLLSAIVTASSYSLVMKTSFALGLVLSLAVHEFGHFYATKYRGLTARWWLFIPFVGALMSAPEFRTREDEAFVAYGGPLIGGIFSLVLFLAWLLLPLSKEWGNVLFSISFISVGINLFNMIPLSPIDGGRITQAIHPLFRWAGFLVLLVPSFYIGEASMLVIWMLVVGDVRLDARKRFVLAGLLWLLMPPLIILGYHGSYVLEDWFFFVLGGWLLRVYYNQYKDPPPAGEYNWRKQDLPKRVRLRWCIRYFALLIVLSVLLYAHIPFLKLLNA